MRGLLPFTLNEVEGKTFRLHLLYSVIEGVILGLLVLNEFVFLKSLRGTNWQVGILYQTSVFVLVFSIFLNAWVNKVRNKQNFIILTALVTRLPLLLLFFFPRDISANPGLWHFLYITIFLMYYMANPIIYPVINLFLKENYTHEHFSVLYSYATTLNKIVMLVVTFAYGALLDANEFSYHIVFPLMGVLGILSVLIFARIPYHPTLTLPDAGSPTGFRTVIRQMQQIMSGNKAFRDFETSFMFYGFAFMGTASVITIFYQTGLGLNYTSVAFYKNFYNIIAILLLPYMGRLMGRIAPRKFAALTFSSLLFFLIFTMITEYFPWNLDVWGIKIYFFLFVSMLFHGVFAATMALLWSIGSAYFCRREEAADYQAIHLTFTGVRSFFAPLLGVWVYEFIGFTGTFSIGIVLLVAAVWISLRSQPDQLSE